MVDTIAWLLLGLPAFIISGTVHEYMHAWTAKRLGDYTATIEGRLSLNPLVHLDPAGLILMIIARFGWMRPVPINEYNFANPVLGTALTAAAGPASNLVMGLVSGLIYNLLPISDSLVITFVSGFLITFVFVNFSLMLFNLLPIPPLDGYRIVRVLIPKAARYQWDMLENYAFLLIFLLFLPFSPLSNIVGEFLLRGVTFAVGLVIQ